MKGRLVLNTLSINTFCQELSPVLQLTGQGLNIFKIFLPIVLIVLGIFDIGKAIISSKSEDVKKNMKMFLRKIAVCVIVFFIPLIGMVIFGFVGGFSDIKDNSGVDFDICYSCMFNPGSEDCKEAVTVAENKY